MITKKCNHCQKTLPLTIEHWTNHHKRGWFFICRPCKKARDRTRDRQAEKRRSTGTRRPTIVEQQRDSDKKCWACASLPWRVEGLRCGECKLARAEEPELQVTDYLVAQPERVPA